MLCSKEYLSLESAYQTFCYTSNIPIYTESVLDTVTDAIDMGFKSVVHFFSDINEIFDTMIKSKDIKDMREFIEKTLKKYPAYGNHKILIRSYKNSTVTFNDYVTNVRNVATRAYLEVEEKRVYDLMSKYHINTGYKDDFFYIKLKDIPGLLSKQLESIKAAEKDMISKLFSFQKDASKYKDDPGFVESVKNLFKVVANKFKKRAEIIYLNIDTSLYQLHRSVFKDVHEKAVKVRSSNIDEKEMMKTAEKVGEITIANLNFDIYRTKYDNVSCFNYKGTQVYLDNTFFDYPAGYQKAVLYHEIGHAVCGHFGEKSSIIDEYKQMKQFKRDIKRYDRMVKFSEFSPTKSLNDDSELLYILIELDADRFSAENGGGKSMMKKALDQRFKDHLDSEIDSSDKDADLIHDFNIERNRLRTTLI